MKKKDSWDYLSQLFKYDIIMQRKRLDGYNK